jgi:hypothetical protein
MPIAATAIATSSGCRAPQEHDEVWPYSAPYDDVVAFFRNQFGTEQNEFCVSTGVEW